MSDINASKTSWDFTKITPKDDELETVESKTYAFINTWKNDSSYLLDDQKLKQALDELEYLYAHYGLTGATGYILGLQIALDQSNPQLLAKAQKLEDFAVTLSNDMEFFLHNLAMIDQGTQIKFLESANLIDYRHFLKRLFDKAKYLLSEPEEKILTLKSSVSHGNWVHMTDSILSKQEAEIKNEDGSTSLKSFSEIMDLLDHENKTVRDSAAKEFNVILDRWVEVGEHEINSIVQNKKTNDELRHMNRPDLSSHIRDDIDPSVVDTMVSVVTQNFDISHEFYKTKAQMLKVDKLAYHERNLQVGTITKDFSYQKSVELVYQAFLHLDAEFAEIFKGYVENGHIDVFPKKGKSSGAFCAHDLKKLPTFVLLNHTNKLQNVLTLAHEAGHGINNELMRTQNALNFGTPLSTAEVASTFFEDFVLEELLINGGLTNAEIKTIHMQKLNDDISTIFRQVAAYNVEKELHTKIREVGYVSKEQIGEIFITHMRAYMGGAVDYNPGSQNWWLYWGHFRSFFYVYSYASGLLISKALQKMVRQDKKNIELVKEFLRAGRSKSPKDIFLELGINIEDKAFWQNGVDEIRGFLNQIAD